jgi:hypothetical protein
LPTSPRLLSCAEDKRSREEQSGNTARAIVDGDQISIWISQPAPDRSLHRERARPPRRARRSTRTQPGSPRLVDSCRMSPREVVYPAGRRSQQARASRSCERSAIRRHAASSPGAVEVLTTRGIRPRLIEALAAAESGDRVRAAST